MLVKDQIAEKLNAGLAPQSLDVEDESQNHAGHAGHRPGGQTHFRVYIVSEAFRGKSRLERHRMVNDVLRLNRGDRAHRERFRLMEFLRGFVEQFSQIERIDAGLIRIDGGADPEVLFDRSHLNQVMWNLCRNALRHSRRVAASIVIRVTADGAGGTVRLDVVDDGPGVAPEARVQLFEPFFGKAQLAAVDFLVVLAHLGAQEVHRSGRPGKFRHDILHDGFAEIGIGDLAMYLDSAGKAMRTLGAVGLPTTLLIGRDGLEIGRLVGPAEWDSAEAVALVRSIIADSSAAKSKTGSPPADAAGPSRQP